MESLYRLHPLFEFYLTIYVAFILAPEFVGYFLFERVPHYIEKSKNNLVKKLNKQKARLNKYKQRVESANAGLIQGDLWQSFMRSYLVSINQAEEKIDALLVDVEKDVSEIVTVTGNPKVEYAAKETRQETIGEDVIKHYEVIKNAKQDKVKKRLATETKKRYDKIFPFAVLYSFFLLAINGCEVAFKETHQAYFLSNISWFNLLCFLYITFLVFCGKGIIDRYEFWITVAIMLIIGIVSFWLIPHYIKWSVWLPHYWFYPSTIVSSILVGAFPLICFMRELLNKKSKKYCQTTYKKEISQALTSVNIVLDDFDFKNVLSQVEAVQKRISRKILKN